MTDRRNVLTPEALAMMDTIARTGSFAAAARELGKVPSALTYNVRQLEDALDVLLFDRSSRQAQFTAAGQELLAEGRRLLQEMGAVANRVRRVAGGWEATLAISVEDILSLPTVYELVESFCGLCDGTLDATGAPNGSPGTRLRLRELEDRRLRQQVLEADRQRALPAAGHALHAVGHRVQLLQQAAAFVQQLGAGGGELGLARTAVEQQHVQRVFELAHAVGQRRRHLAQLARGGGEAAGAGDGVHHLQRFGGQRLAAVGGHRFILFECGLQGWSTRRRRLLPTVSDIERSRPT